METVLVDGWIRNIEKLLKTKKPIPSAIKQICFDYYFTINMVFYLCGITQEFRVQSPFEPGDLLCAANIENQAGKSGYKINIHQLNNHRSTITLNHIPNDEGDWAVDTSGISYTQNLQLPQSVNAKLPFNNTGSNHILFRVCGSSNDATDYCGALIIDSQQFLTPNKQPIAAYNWRLPDFPTETIEISSLYSPLTNSLYAIHETSLYELSFNNQAYIDQRYWRWELLTDLPDRGANMNQVRSMVMLNNQKLFMVGCYEFVDIYDVNKQKQETCKSRIYQSRFSGIFYDEIGDRIFSGGGVWQDDNDYVGPSNKMEYYDIQKDIWTALPDMNDDHDYHPYIWLTDNNNMLNIMSISSNSHEQIDLRQSNKKWRMVEDYNVGMKFDTVFYIKEEMSQLSRLVGNNGTN